MKDSQTQKGGDGSTNIQTQQLVVNMGIDEKRAREIYHEMNLQLRNDYAKEALAVANSRVAEFENKLMPKMAQVSGALEAFADPSFQLLLHDAQKAAAATERPADYDLLSELLVHRFLKGQNRVTRAGISRAVEIVDQIADESLLGLTVAHAVNSIRPTVGGIHQGLAILDDLFGKLLYDKLPTGNEWIEHLEILDAVRINPMTTLKKIGQYYPEILSGYVDVGIEKGSGNYQKAIRLLRDFALPFEFLVGHEFNNAFVRIAVPNKEAINNLVWFRQVSGGYGFVTERRKLDEKQIDTVIQVYDLYSQDANLKQSNIESFMEKWNKLPNLKLISQWWDNIPIAFALTTVGKVLAHSNAQRCEKSLPPLD